MSAEGNEGRDGRNTKRPEEVEKGQAQITLAVTRASGRKGDKV